MKTNATPIRNGNKLVKAPHIFVPGQGCFWPDEATAIAHGTSPNGVGLWVETIEFEGATHYQAGNSNVWD
jgi:hypothetical protein